MSEKSDEVLAKELQADDHAALAELMERYTGKLLRYGRRFLSSEDEAGDVVQDVFIAAYQNINDFDAARRFSPWIYRIAHNAFVDILRKKAKEPLPMFDLDRALPHLVWENPEEGEKEREAVRVLLEKSLKGLPPLYREVIDLYYFEDFSYREIADILHIPVGTVAIRLSRARAVLKKQFPQDIHD